MSPPSSNDPRSPNGRSPDEPVRGDRTRWEYKEAEQTPPKKERNQPTSFGLAPMVTQPFPAFTHTQAELPAAPAPAPAPPAPIFARAPEGALRPAAPVSVGRMQGIGTPSASPQQPPLVRSRAEEPHASTPARAPETFGRTFFAAGHRPVVEERVPEPRPPVPAYPSQPYADPRAQRESPVSYVREPALQPSTAVRSRVDEPRSSTPRDPVPAHEPRVNPQQVVTTSLDVNDIMMKYPVPMPAVRGEEDSSSAWSAPVAESPRSSIRGRPEQPRAGTPRPEERALPYPSPKARGDSERVAERAHRKAASSTFEHDEIDVNRVLGRSNMKGLLLGCAAAVSLGLLGLSIYVKHAREAEAEQLAAASEPATAALPAEPVPSPASAQLGRQLEEEEEAPPPTGAVPDEDPEVPTRAPRARAEQPELPTPAARKHRTQPEAREVAPEVDKPPAVHSSTGGVSAGSAAALYINGQYKEALAEYQLLSRAYPKQPVYRELARILRRKLIETCMRTQPNRREQCKTM